MSKIEEEIFMEMPQYFSKTLEIITIKSDGIGR